MSFKSVIIYTTSICPYCNMAKKLLTERSVEYSEILLDGDEEGRKNLILISNGQKTIPQIFINGKHIGGYSDLKALLEAQELEYSGN